MTDPSLRGDVPVRETRKPDDRRNAGDFGKVGVLGAVDTELLGNALQRARKSGGIDAGIIGVIGAALQDLATFDHTAASALDGETSRAEVEMVFGSFPPWPADLRSGRSSRNGGDAGAGVFTMRSPGAPLMAAYLAGGAAEQSGEGGRLLAQRAMTGMLSRMEPVARVVHAARALAAKALGIEEFAQVAAFAAKVLDAALDPRELMEALSKGPMPLPFPLPIDPDGGWVLPRRPPIGAWLLPENQAWAQCALGLIKRFPPPPRLPDKSPGTGAVVPASICAGAIVAGGHPITIRSAGSGFGATQDRWGLSVNGVTATITSWSDSAIQLTSTALRPGCNQIRWTYALDWSYDDEGVGDACAQSLRLPMIDIRAGLLGLLQDQSRFWLEPGSVSVLAPSIASFIASSGTNGTEAVPCEAVTLRWSIGDLPCGTERSQVSVRLLRNGVPVVVAAPFVGTYTEITRPFTEQDTGYTLEVSSVDGSGMSCGTVVRSLTVERGPKRLALNIPSEVFAARSVMGTVTIPCPASAGGLVVTLAAMPASALTLSPSVTILQGMRSAQFPLEAGTTCGAVTLTATAADHLDAAAVTCSVLTPKIDVFTPPTDLKACEPNTLSLTASCISAPPTLTASAVSTDGTKTALGVQVPAGGSCVRSSLVTLRMPALAPGDYLIELTDRGGSVRSATRVTLAPNPLIRNAPTSVAFTVANATCPSQEETVSVTVSGADAVDFEYTSPDGTVPRTVSRPGGGMVCATWTARFTHPFDRVGTVTVTPKLGMVSGPSRTVAITINAASNVYSAVILRGTDNSGRGRTATLVRQEEDPMLPGEFVETPADSVTEQTNTAPIPLRRCRFTILIASRPAVADPSSSSGGMISASIVPTAVMIGHPDAPVSPVIQI